MHLFDRGKNSGEKVIEKLYYVYGHGSAEVIRYSAAKIS